jgi:transcription-repair coupling factor (superfamily II helicase)
MLKQAVNKMQGRRVARPVEVSLRADFLVMNEALMVDAPSGMTPAFLPTEFIEDPKLRIQAYRGLGEVMTKKELKEKKPLTTKEPLLMTEKQPQQLRKRV